MTWGNTGAIPGRYHAHLYTEPHGPSLPAKYADSRTSGLEIDIASDWNDLNIDLRESRVTPDAVGPTPPLRDSTLANLRRVGRMFRRM